jgi:acyl-CoA synthetase (AMP-forming)/AMP-acid ligase II
VNTATALELAAGRSPRRLAVVEGDRRLTYAELAEQVRAVACGLARSGVGTGDSAVLAVANSLEAAVAVLAVQAAGAVAVPINFRSRGVAIYSALRMTAASAIIVDEQAAAAVSEVANDARPPIVLTINGARCPSGVPLGTLARMAPAPPPAAVSGDAPAIALRRPAAPGRRNSSSSATGRASPGSTACS